MKTIVVTAINNVLKTAGKTILTSVIVLDGAVIGDLKDDAIKHVGVVTPATIRIVIRIVIPFVVRALAQFVMNAVIPNHVVVVLLHAQVDRVQM